jgi:hypothetical protein
VRTVATLSPQFWIGETGRELRPALAGSKVEREQLKDARIVAMYLTNAPSSTMFGLYYVTVRTIAEETGLFEDEVRAALARLDRLDYARYDYKTEFVWVLSMAWHQLGGPLKPADRRVIHVNTWYRALPKNPWLGPFFDRYKDTCLLEERREGVTRDSSTPLLRFDDATGSPFDGAKDLRQIPDLRKEGVQGEPKTVEAPVDEWFDEFLKAYPSNRRVGGETGRRAFREALRQGSKQGPARQTWGRMRRALEAHKRSEQWQTPRLVPSMTKWLAEARWNQDLEEAIEVEEAPTGAWADILERLEVKLNRNQFLRWFKPLRAGPENGVSLTVITPDEHYEGWIRKHYAEQLQEACAETGRPGLQVTFTTTK